MISEQVNHLKELSDTAKANVYSFEALSQSLREAADTIESLSAKLQAANMERSAEDYGGWMDFVYETVRGKEVARWKWRDRISLWEVIAWHKLPEPYNEP